jgi:1-acyl-sn-glycerol-3-phosphate acyltransferase
MECSVWYLLFKYVLIGPVLWVIGRPRITGMHHIPKSGPVILASNHKAVADSFFLALMIRRRMTFVAKAEYFNRKGFKGWLMRWFFTAVGQVSIDRNDPDAAAGALRTAERILREGGIWGIYPEGTRSPDGRLYKGKTGVMRVALTTGAPVLPVVMTGTEQVNPRGSRRLRFGRVGITVGAPLDLARFAELAQDRRVVRSATDQLMAELHRASGQEYVDEYARSDSRAQV